MPTTIVLPAFAPDQPAARVDAELRAALAACDRARECAVLWFAEVQRRGLHREFGYASLELYATQGLGFPLNRYWQFKRLSDDLDRLPVLREAVAVGELGWTKAQQVARVATPDTQAAWVTKAATTGRRELAREVRAARAVAQSAARQVVSHEAAPAPPLFAAPGCQPAAVAPAQVEATVTLRGDALQVARFEALLERARKLRRAPAHAGRLEVVLEALAALVEGDLAGDGVRDGADDRAGAGTRAGAAAADLAARHQAIRPAVQIVVQQCPDCAAASVATARGDLPLAPAQVEALACDARVRDTRGAAANRATIPPRTRAAVLARDRHRCATPGCRATRFLEVHHVIPRARGGSNDAANLVTLCSRCHGFAHDERAVVATGAAAPGADATCAGASGSASA